MNKTLNKQENIIFHAQEVLNLEFEAIKNLVGLLDQTFVKVVHLILQCQGKLVFSGIGKAGLVAQKVASTFSSLGRASFFINSAEASHGDLGMIEQKDLVFLFSNSGGTKEVNLLIPVIRKIGSSTVAITGQKKSYLYQEVDHPLFIGELQEACGLGLAPTTSTTTMMALGDALAIAVLKQDKSFDERKFAFYHPGGSLGKKLMLVKELMRKKTEIVSVNETCPVKQVIMKMTQTRIGTAVIVCEAGKVSGVFSDGDLRRNLERDNIFNLSIGTLMTRHPYKIKHSQYVSDATQLMNLKQIGELPVIDDDEKLIGVACLKDLI